MKVSEHFDLREFVDPTTYAQKANRSIDSIDKKLIDIAEFIRVKVNQPVTINNWHMGGQFKESGFRNKNSTTGAKLSQHKFGKAIDVKSAGYDGVKWYEFVKENAKELFQLGVRRIEDKGLATTWLHIDTKDHGKQAIFVVDLVSITEVIEII